MATTFKLRKAFVKVGAKAKAGVASSIAFGTGIQKIISGTVGSKAKSGVLGTVQYAQFQAPSGFFAIPSLLDERATYDRWGWIRTTSDEQFDFVTPPTLTAAYDVHNETENDDLLTWLRQSLRGYGSGSQSSLVASWLASWLTYFKGPYITMLQNQSAAEYQNDYDHVYGTGLVLQGVVNGDSAAIAAAEAAGDVIINEWTIGHDNVTAPPATSQWWSRAHGRWLQLFCYLSMIPNGVNTAKWVLWRDRMINNALATTTWEEQGTNGIVQGGLYYWPRDHLPVGNPEVVNNLGDGSNNNGGTVQFDAGRRFNSTFYTGIIAEALWRAYLCTGRTDVRDRLVKLARFAQYYAHTPTATNGAGGPFTGAYFGHQAGNYYHREPDSNDLDGPNPGTPIGDVAAATYDISVVNLLVWGYKITGDSALLDRAKIHFRQGTRWAETQPQSSGQGPVVPANEVMAFVDTKRKTPELITFSQNKGQLQYCYQIFENGGLPATATPAYVLNLAAFESRELVGATYGPTVGQPTARQSLLDGWATTQPSFSASSLYFHDYSGGCEDRTNRRIFIIGGGHASTVCNGVTYFDANDDGTGKPRGWFGVPGSFSQVAQMQSVGITGFVNAPVMIDGRPNASHAYHSPSYYAPLNRFYKLGRSSSFVSGVGGSSGPGGSMGYIDLNTAAPWPANSWNTSIPSDSIGDRLAGDQIIQSPDGTKALLFAHYNAYNSNGLGQFFRYATNTWGSTATMVAPHLPPDGNGTGGHLVWDSVRNKLVRVTCNIADIPGGVPNFGQADVDWNAETISNAQAITINNSGPMLANTTSGGPNGRAVWFDANRRYRGIGAFGVIWVYGNRANNLNTLAAANADTALHTITEIGYISATVREATTYNITGTKPRYTYSIDGGASHGLGNRLVFVDEWRVVFVASAMNSGVFALKLPGVAEATGSFSTLFNTSENPISEGGTWTKAATEWQAMKITGGMATAAAYVTDTPTVKYDDAYAKLATSTFTAPNDNYRITATVQKGAAGAGEIELLARVVDTSTTIHCYELLVNTGGSCELVRWNGRSIDGPWPIPGGFEEISATSVGTGGLATGDKIRLSVQTIDATTVRITAEKAAAATPSSFVTLFVYNDTSANRKTSGQPGIASFLHAASGNLNNHGWSDFLVEAI